MKINQKQTLCSSVYISSKTGIAPAGDVYVYNMVEQLIMQQKLLYNSAPLPPTPLPRQGKGEAVLIKRKHDNQRFNLNRIPLPLPSFGEFVRGVGYKKLIHNLKTKQL